jgi:hypothetical protein
MNHIDIKIHCNDLFVSISQKHQCIEKMAAYLFEDIHLLNADWNSGQRFPSCQCAHT